MSLDSFFTVEFATFDFPQSRKAVSIIYFADGGNEIIGIIEITQLNTAVDD